LPQKLPRRNEEWGLQEDATEQDHRMHPYDVHDEKPAKLGAILYLLVVVTKSFLVYDRSIRNKIHKERTMTIDVLP
jgi:hypothetical protein